MTSKKEHCQVGLCCILSSISSCFKEICYTDISDNIEKQRFIGHYRLQDDWLPNLHSDSTAVMCEQQRYSAILMTQHDAEWQGIRQMWEQK